MFHTILLIGNLGKDPEMRYLPDGRPVTTMSVATNRTYKDANGQQVKETVWFRVSVFGKTAESCAQYLAKGRMVLVEGRLRPDPQTGGPKIWTRQDGTAGASFEVFATNVRFMPGGARGEPGAPAALEGDDLATVPDTYGEEDIPF
jgi:single-strand DNA-binding protein